MLKNKQGFDMQKFINCWFSGWRSSALCITKISMGWSELLIFTCDSITIMRVDNSARKLTALDWRRFPGPSSISQSILLKINRALPLARVRHNWTGKSLPEPIPLDFTGIREPI
jgi:hypothetical protein